MHAAFLSLIALGEITESASIIQLADVLAYADDAADGLDGYHQRRVGELYATRLALEQGEEQLLLRDMPAAIAWRETVGMVPAKLVDALLQALLHPIGAMLGNDAAQGIDNKHPHHVALLLEVLLVGLEINSAGADKERVGFTTAQLAQDNLAHIEVW